MAALAGDPAAGYELLDRAAGRFRAMDAGAYEAVVLVDAAQAAAAVARYGDDHAAYRNREAAFANNLLAKWADPAEEEACRSWACSADERVERFGAGAAYLNFLPAEGRNRCGPRLAPMRTPSWSPSRTATTQATCSGLTTTSVPAADRTD